MRPVSIGIPPGGHGRGVRVADRWSAGRPVLPLPRAGGSGRHSTGSAGGTPLALTLGHVDPHPRMVRTTHRRTSSCPLPVAAPRAPWHLPLALLLAACGGPEEAVRTCSTDAECGPGALCLQSACVANRPPVAALQVPASPATNRVLFIDATATDPDPGDAVARFTWSVTPLGAGCEAEPEPTTGPRLEVVFWCAGTYEVSVLAEDGRGGASAPARQIVEVAAGDRRAGGDPAPRELGRPRLRRDAPRLPPGGGGQPGGAAALRHGRRSDRRRPGLPVARDPAGRGGPRGPGDLRPGRHQPLDRGLGGDAGREHRRDLALPAARHQRGRAGGAGRPGGADRQPSARAGRAARSSSSTGTRGAPTWPAGPCRCTATDPDGDPVTLTASLDESRRRRLRRASSDRSRPVA